MFADSTASLPVPLVNSNEVHPFHAVPSQAPGSVHQYNFCSSRIRRPPWFCAPWVASCLTPAGAAGVLCRTWIIMLCRHTVPLPFLPKSLAVSFAVVGASKVGVLFSLRTTIGSSVSLLPSSIWPLPQQAWLSEHTPFAELKTSLLRSPLICSAFVI